MENNQKELIPVRPYLLDAYLRYLLDNGKVPCLAIDLTLGHAGDWLVPAIFNNGCADTYCTLPLPTNPYPVNHVFTKEDHQVLTYTLDSNIEIDLHLTEPLVIRIPLGAIVLVGDINGSVALPLPQEDYYFNLQREDVPIKPKSPTLTLVQ